jgi:regulator of protease activity HflC (stomatin/prohibitin superfamily)
MANVRSYPFFRHLRAEANQFVLHYRGGRVVRKGAGLSYWFNPLRAAIAQVPAEDCETTFLLQERSSDLQDVVVQVTLTYRFADPERAAGRVNFSISPDNGTWLEQPLERLASVWRQRCQQPARSYLQGVTLVEAIRAGAVVVRDAIEQALRADAEIGAMGMALVSVQVDRTAPNAELEKALQTPTRESLQQKADEAVFQRRALAVEKERAIKENELATEIELARRQETLIQQQGVNKLLAVQQEAESEKQRIEGEAQRALVAAEGQAKAAEARARGEADGSRLVAAAELEAETRRAALWADTPGRVLLGLALREAAGNLQSINHLNVTPDLLGESFKEFLRDQSGS